MDATPLEADQTILADARSLLLVLGFLQFDFQRHPPPHRGRVQDSPLFTDELEQAARALYPLAKTGVPSTELITAIHHGAEVARRAVLSLEPHTTDVQELPLLRRILAWLIMLLSFGRASDRRMIDARAIAHETLRRLDAIITRTSDQIPATASSGLGMSAGQYAAVESRGEQSDEQIEASSHPSAIWQG